MNRNVVIIIILALAITAIIVSEGIIQDPTMEHSIKRLQADIKSSNWKAASQSLHVVDELWKKREPLSRIGDLAEPIDAFDRSLTRLHVYIQEREHTEALSESAILLREWFELDD